MFAVASCCSLMKLLCLSARSLRRLSAGVTPTSTEIRETIFSPLNQIIYVRLKAFYEQLNLLQIKYEQIFSKYKFNVAPINYYV